MGEKMRPTINLSWVIHGKVKAYKETNKISLTEAYSVVLNEGLKNLNL